jgi:hypothetical protein
MVREGKYEEALGRFIWFHDHALEYNSAMAGVRLSFALEYWKWLGNVYPPAQAALEQTRDKKAALLDVGKGDFNLFHDVLAINRTLKEDEKTINLFRKLDQEQPQLAKVCWSAAKDVLIQAKTYDLIRKYMESVTREFIKVKAMYDMNTAMYGENNYGESFKRYNQNHFVEQSVRLIEVAIALNDTAAAREIQEKALAILDDPRIRRAF